MSHVIRMNKSCRHSAHTLVCLYIHVYIHVCVYVYIEISAIFFPLPPFLCHRLQQQHIMNKNESGAHTLVWVYIHTYITFVRICIYRDICDFFPSSPLFVSRTAAAPHHEQKWDLYMNANCKCTVHIGGIWFFFWFIFFFPHRDSRALWATAAAHSAHNWGLYVSLAWLPTFFSQFYYMDLSKSSFYSWDSQKSDV